MNRLKLREAADFIKKYHKFLITSHISPDGDALGSELALHYLLKRLKKESFIINSDGLPKRYSFLPGAYGIKEFKVQSSASQIRDYGSNSGKTRMPKFKVQNSFEAVIVLECSQLSRFGKVSKLVDKRPILNIDHHLDNGNFGLINWVEPKVSACGEQIYELTKYFKVRIDKEIALPIYVSILTDTGNFHFNTTPLTHRICAELLKRTGMSAAEINEAIYENVPLSTFRLFHLAFSTLKSSDDGRFYWMKVRTDMFKKSGARQEQTEDFLDFIRPLEGSNVIFLLKEISGGTKVSLRSKGDYDVQKIAAEFGGGGHKNAAGCVIKEGMGKAEELILEALYGSFSKE